MALQSIKTSQEFFAAIDLRTRTPACPQERSGPKDHRRDTMDRPPLAYCCEVRDEAALCDGAICTESGQVKKD